MKIRVYVRKEKVRGSWQMFYIDPLTRKRKTKIATDETTGEPIESRKDALKAAGVWEKEVASGTDEKVDTPWEQFKLRFEDEYLPSRAHGSASVYMASLRKFEAYSNGADLSRINASTMSQFQAWLRRNGFKETTIVMYLKHCRAAFRWAARLGMIRKAPEIEMPRLVVSQLAGGKPVTLVEYRRMLATAPKVLKKDVTAIEDIRRLISGLWYSGLRISEACRLSWDQPPVILDLESGKFPRIVWHASGHKARRDERSPITPDFFDFIQKTPKKNRSGLVFPVRLKGRAIGKDRISRLISEIATKAKLPVTAHDFRRSFGTRWAQEVLPVTLKAVMRHADIKTTLAYYVDLESDDVGEKLWAGRATPRATQNRSSNGTSRKTAPRNPR